MPLNHATLEGLEAAGIDLLADHPDDLPPQYREWLERTATRSAADVAHDDILRTDSSTPCRASSRPTTCSSPPRCPACRWRTRRSREHDGAVRGRRRRGRRADRLVSHLPLQLHRPPGVLDPCRHGRRPAGRDADRRPARRRRRRAGGQRRLRAPATVARQLRAGGAQRDGTCSCAPAGGRAPPAGSSGRPARRRRSSVTTYGSAWKSTAPDSENTGRRWASALQKPNSSAQGEQAERAPAPADDHRERDVAAALGHVLPEGVRRSRWRGTRRRRRRARRRGAPRPAANPQRR